ncbi:MAG TPA: hypothetical protein VGC41_24540 [Kofleriaceae bacterium]
MEDSPPQFIKIRNPRSEQVADRVDLVAAAYQKTLDLVELVHIVLEHTESRFHVKDRLDRAVTTVTLEIARAGVEVRANRWRHYRTILDRLADVCTSLDIIERQHSTQRPIELMKARAVGKELMEAIRPLAKLGND